MPNATHKATMNHEPSDWHARGFEEALKATGADRQSGLTDQEAADRLLRNGLNTLPEGKSRGPLTRFLAQFKNVLIYVLLIAAAITFFLDQAIDAAVILAVVLINAVIGFVQEGKAESALKQIRNMLSPFAQVLRGGHKKEIPAQDLVVGDIVFIAAGDRVPADIRLIDIFSLSVQEAALTGESLAVEKSIAPVKKESPLGDRHCMAYSGTMVTAGQAVGVVIAVGQATQIGHISKILAAVEELATPLIRKMQEFSKWLSLAILLFASAAFAFGYWVRDYNLNDMFMVAVGIAVAAIPEGLPAIMTISLAIGVQRMALRKAIIRKLPVVEALGSVTIICSDKTGTLTRNEMTVQRVVTSELDATISGAGYEPKGRFSVDQSRIEAADYPVLQQLGRVASLCNDAALTQESVGEWVLAGDPTEGALITLTMKMDMHPDKLNQAYPRIDVLPFDSAHQFMATLHNTPTGEQVVFLKGAPERVLALCDSAAQDTGSSPIDRKAWLSKMESLAMSGMRVLAIAQMPSPGHDRLKLQAIQKGGFSLLGLVGMTDPPRQEVIQSIAACHTAGITVKMITGDHLGTAQAIGQLIGIGAPGQAQKETQEKLKTLGGHEIDQLDDAALIQVAQDAHVFARATPEHKLRLVKALQAQGHVVAMTGDGVNDAPALKRADVGVAMGKKGTEAAKEASDMVLADDNFASITASIEEGRTVYDNIRKAIVFILPTNGGEAGMLIVAIALGLTMPITPVQILWINMVTAITLALSIAFEKSERSIMRRPPRPPNEPLIAGFLLWRIIFVSVLLIAGSLAVFLWQLDRGLGIEVARTSAVNALVVGELVYLFNSRHLTQSVMNREGLLGNPIALWACGALIVLQLLLTYLPTMQTLFGTAGLDWQAWLAILAMGIGLFFIIEMEKKFISRKGLAH